MSSQADLPNSNISNEELRRRLTQFKVDCGPVTTSTRRVLLKKLAKLEEEARKSLGSGVVYDEIHDDTSDDSSNQIDDSLIINGKHGNHTEQVENGSFSHETTRTPKKNSPRRYSPRRKTTDEIEAIKAFNEIKNKQLKSKQPASENFKPKTPEKTRSSKTILINDTPPKLDQYSSESSESDDDVIENTPPPPPSSITSFLSNRVVPPRIFNGSPLKPPLGRPPIRRTIDNKVSNLQNYSDSESEVDDAKNNQLCQMLLSHRSGLSRAPTGKKNSYFGKISSFFSNIKKKLSPSQTDSSNVNFSASNYVSFALLIFVFIFFIVIFSVYFFAKFTLNSKHALDLNDYAFIEDKTKLVAPICKSELEPNCLPFETDRKPTLNIVKEIRSFIDKSYYDYHCEWSNSAREISSFEFKADDIFKNLESKVDPLSEERDASLQHFSRHNLYKRDFDNAIKLINLNPLWNLKTDELASFELKILPTCDYIVQLPLRCNLWIFWRTHLLSVGLTSLAIIIPLLGFLYYRKTKRVKTEEQSLVYDLIEKSIELLQSPDEPQSMPVLHIRDTLLSPSERKSKKYRGIWSKVVNHIENAESRVKVEYKKIDGEDFKAWKWIASNSGGNFSDSELDLDGSIAPMQTQKIGGVEWQGQAFGNVLPTKNALLSPLETRTRNNTIASPASNDVLRNRNFQALTCFLKIRNIFQREGSYRDPNWEKKIKNTILEKTANASASGTHDIVHIELEDNSNEGLVYLKCGSIAGATNAFHALHGWWCEKKLVSVKFLKEDRYNMRFPAAKTANTALKIEPLN